MATVREAAEMAVIDKVVSDVTRHERLTRTKLRRISQFITLADHPYVLEIGAGCGSGIAGWIHNGCECVGLEPYTAAIETAHELSERLEIPISVTAGTAEDIPFDDAVFDIVNAQSVMEHVDDVERVVSEVYRVLKPGGVFMFNCASAMCPRQDEIDGFPLFGWYPNALKLRIMRWARDHRPALIGHTDHPAINWATTWGTRARLQRHGFRQMWDRWDLRRIDEGGLPYRMVLRAIRWCSLTKFVADVLVSDCGWAAVK